MAINLPSGLNITTNEAVDSRILLTKEQMKNIADAKMPDKYFCICLDDSNLYIYNKSATPNEVTGKFTSLSIDLNSTEIQSKIAEIVQAGINDGSVEIKPASAESVGGVKSSPDKNSVTVNEDGTMNVNSIGVEKLSNTEGTTLVLDGGFTSV